MLQGWPEKFVYVCSATRSAIVNALPLVHAGLTRVARVEVLVGADERESEELDREGWNEAFLPALNLEWWLTQACAPDPPVVCRHYGNPDSFSVWATHMGAVVERAAKDGLTIVFNVSGGRRPMAVGALIGAAGRAQVIAVAGSSSCVEFIDGLQQREATRQAEMTLDDLLAVYGLAEIDRASRIAKQEFYRRHASAIDAAASTFLDWPDREAARAALSVLNGALRGVGGSSRFNRKTIPIKDDPQLPPIAPVIRAASECLRPVGDFDARQYGEELLVEFGEPQVAMLLRGQWLEGLIYNRICEWTRGRNDVEVSANVRLAHRLDEFGRTRVIHRGLELGEIDVALMVRSRLHIIEAKTARFSGRDLKDQTARSFEKIGRIRQLLQKQFGACVIVNPRETKESLMRSGDFPTRAADAGVSLLFGDDVMNKRRTIIREVL
ncbi:MAG: DUF1887 family CARF protein [Roseiarcus sp.]